MMATEGIDFNEDGTVTVRFDGQTWTLRRPKFSHWRKYSREFTRAAEDSIAELRRLSERVKAYEHSEDTEAKEAAEAALRDHNDNSIINDRTRILSDIFGELGDRPLPDDTDEWPTWLILSPLDEPAVAAKILNHWRNVPKASSKQSTG